MTQVDSLTTHAAGDTREVVHLKPGVVFGITRLQMCFSGVVWRCLHQLFPWTKNDVCCFWWCDCFSFCRVNSVILETFLILLHFGVADGMDFNPMIAGRLQSKAIFSLHPCVSRPLRAACGVTPREHWLEKQMGKNMATTTVTTSKSAPSPVTTVLASLTLATATTVLAARTSLLYQFCHDLETFLLPCVALKASKRFLIIIISVC